MSDTTISFDGDTSKAEAKLKSLKRSAERTGQSFGAAQAGALAGRLGGPAGGMASRFIGGGMAGMGVAAAGAGLSAIMSIDRSRMEIAQAQEQARQRLAMGRADGIKSRAALNASASGSAGIVSRYVSRGRAGLEYQPEELAKRRGISAFVAAESLAIGQDTGVSADQIAWLMSTGEFGSPQEAATAIRDNGGIVNALASRRGISLSEADTQLERSVSSPEMINIGKARSSDAALFSQQVGALASGGTASAIAANMAAELNPEQSALDAIAASREQIISTGDALQKAAEAQSALGKAFATIGQMFGGEGTAASKLYKHTRANAE